MKTNSELIQVLDAILIAKSPNRTNLIKNFQDKVWHNNDMHDNALNDILLELAYDFDFYEPNEEWRKESVSYYGDDKLRANIESVIQKLQA